MTPGGTRHEHIVSVYWTNESDSSSGSSDVNPTMVNFIDNENGKAFVWDGTTRADVRTVHPATGRAYIRTMKDGVWTDNLLALPLY
jgi:hypothetical protein